MKRKATLTFKLLLTFLFLYFIFTKYFDYTNFEIILVKVNFILLVLLLFINFFSRVIQAYQIKKCMLHFSIEHNAVTIIKAQLISTFYSFILPGDLASAGVTWHLLSRDKIKKIQIASILAYIRILNMVTLIPFAIMGLYFETRLASLNANIYILLFSLLLLIIILPFFWRPATILSESISMRIIGHFGINKISNLLQKSWNSVYMFHKIPTKNLFTTLGLSMLFHITNIFLLWAAMYAVNIEVPVTVFLWILPFLTIIHSLPITIAGTGVRELTLIFMLQFLYNVPPEKSLILSFIILFVAMFFGAFGAILHIADRYTNS